MGKTSGSGKVMMMDWNESAWMRLITNDAEVARQIEIIAKANPIIPTQMFGKYFVIQQWEGNSEQFTVRMNEIKGVLMTERWWQPKQVTIQRVPNSDDVLMVLDNTFYVCKRTMD